MSSKTWEELEDLRSQQWFGCQDRDGFAYRSWLEGKGVPHDQFDGRPVIGICNTWSRADAVQLALPPLAEHVKSGVSKQAAFRSSSR